MSRSVRAAFVAAVAIGEAWQGILPAGRRVSLKWPNDVLADGRKVAGILLESEGARADGVDGLVVGFGIGVVVGAFAFRGASAVHAPWRKSAATAADDTVYHQMSM